MYIDVVPNRNSPPAVLLREAFREGQKPASAPWPTSPTGPQLNIAILLSDSPISKEFCDIGKPAVCLVLYTGVMSLRQSRGQSETLFSRWSPQVRQLFKIEQTSRSYQHTLSEKGSTS